MNHFKVKKYTEAGYCYEKLIDESRPVIQLIGNGYVFNSLLIKREPLKLSKRKSVYLK